MFKFKSYNVKKVSEKNEKEQAKSSSSTGTLKKSPSSSLGTKSSSSSSSGTKKKTFARKEEIKSANNRQSPDYSRKIYPKKTVTKWNENTTYSAKNETKKVFIPSPHKKLERK